MPFRVIFVAMRRLVFIVFIFAFTVGEADARHRGHSRSRYWGHSPRMMVAPSPYAPGRSAQAYTREQRREFPPPTWQLQPPDPGWKGRRFVSADGNAWLAFYASPADGEPRSAHLKAVAFADGEEIVTLHAGPDQLTVSGAKLDRAFYRKARLACGGRQWHHVAIEFPYTTDPRQAQHYELLIAQAAWALDLADDDGCAAPVAENTSRNE